MLIKRKLPIAIMLLIAVPLILLGLIIYRVSANFLVESSREQIQQLTKIQSKTMETLTYAQKKEAELLAQNRTILSALGFWSDSIDEFSALQREAPNTITKYLREASEKLSEVDHIFIADSKGAVIAGSDESMIGINVGDRNYFMQAIKGNTVLSDVIESRLNGDLVVIVATPIRDEEEMIIGILGNIISIKYFASYVKEIILGTSGYGFLIDSNGVIIYHPVPGKIGTLVVNEVSKEIIATLKRGEPVKHHVSEYKYQGKDKFMGYCVIPEVNWVLTVAQDSGEIISSAKKSLYIIFSVTILMLLISVTMSISFSVTITDPIDKLIAAMKRAEEGDLTAECEFTSKDEFGQLARSYNMMLQKLNLSYEELTAVYEELSATEEELRAQYDELQHNEEALRNGDERFRLAIDGANDAIWEWNLENNHFFTSDKWLDITGYKIKTTKVDIKYMLKRVIHPDDMERAVADFNSHLEGKTPYYASEFRIRTRAGKYKWVFNRGKALNDSNGKPVKLAGSLTDISDRKKHEENIEFLAYYDPLTKLPNRTLFMERLNEELRRPKSDGQCGAVFFIDFDDFKKINDTLGHDYGDHILKIIAEKISAVKGDNDIICRFGGDEFLILMPEVASREQVVKLADSILESFNSNLETEEKQMYITCSIGITLYPKDGTDTNVILKNADTAMYKAKEAGKNKYVFYDQDMYDKLERRIRIEQVLRGAIQNEELKIYYQPQFDAQTKKIVGFEALLRLFSKELGVISPAEFIPVAEETGLIVAIGEWVLLNACRKSKEWQDRGLKQCYISVNISSAQLQQVNFLSTVMDILKETKLPSNSLELEITESMLMKSMEDNVKILEELRKNEIKIALDDFGTGYSSLNYLRKIPIDTLKIDKSFIDGICQNSTEEAIAEGIIQLAHKMQLKVVAEGVETLQQLEILQEKNCDRIQGYLFSKPLPEEQIEEILVKEYIR